MKALFLTTVIVCFSFAAIAQQNPSMENNAWQFNTAEVVKKNFQPHAILIDQSADNKIYALPLDNMPCIVPSVATNAIMPVAAKNFNNNIIPNGLNKFQFMPPIVTENIRPQNKKHKTTFKGYKPVTSPNLMLQLVKKK